eukprot:1380820-Lingulodinium_polyedra.AAC.1
MEWVREIKHTKETGTEKRRLYMGELEQLHGVEEAHRFVAQKKYKLCYDSDGDECYEKVTK